MLIAPTAGIVPEFRVPEFLFQISGRNPNVVREPPNFRVPETCFGPKVCPKPERPVPR